MTSTERERLKELRRTAFLLEQLLGRWWWGHWVEADRIEYHNLINAKTYPNISSILRKIDKELKEEANEQQIPLG